MTHWALGHINWALAGEFALGQVPGSAAGGQFAHHVQGPVIRRAFGLFLIAFGLFFVIYRIVATEADAPPLPGSPTMDHCATGEIRWHRLPKA